MALSARLEMRTSQSLVMTPQLMQAIKLLQMSNLDLMAYVDTELQTNPLLERAVETEPDDGEGARPEEERGPVETASEVEGEWLASETAPSGDQIASVLDSDLANVFPDEPAEARPGGLDAGALAGSTRLAVAGDFDPEAFLAAEPTLHQHLENQLSIALADPRDRLIGRDLIDGVDEAGYLRSAPAATAERLRIPIDEVERVLGVLQGFEPAGVFARDLGECLALQLRERDRLDPAMAALLRHLDALARGDLALLRRVCSVDAEDLADMIGEIRRLDPRPGHVFGQAPVHTVIPDVIVERRADGDWAVELNTETLPRVLVNQAYYAVVSRATRSERERAYLSECFQNANWLVKSLDQRARTILKVASEIVRQQDAFLAHGVAHLKPLNLRTVADAIGMHESTVSRVTSHKFMATGRGIFELKYFFTASIAASDGGEAHSAEAVRHRIRRMIDEEDPAAILSDDAIVQALGAAGVEIARRTVAKYREAMRIPSSVQRRRQKRAAAAS